jgi:hypothetical protein
MIKSRRVRWAGTVARIGEMRKAMLGKPEGKKPLGRHRRRREDIKMHLGKWGWRVWTGFIWLRIHTSGGLFRTQL